MNERRFTWIAVFATCLLSALAMVAAYLGIGWFHDFMFGLDRG
ncbi:hypothetical protein [Lysobacter enzymogenes]|nr:hypothetical protein [Lysobacter enzymogenes]